MNGTEQGNTEKSFFTLPVGLDSAFAAGDPSWLAVLRQEALASFKETGLPGPKIEAWKYTDLAALSAQEFGFEAVSPRTSVLTRLKDMGFNPQDAQVMVFVNGRFEKSLSSLKNQGNRIRLQNLASVLSEEDLQWDFGRVLPFQGRPMTALNTALFQDGLFLHIPDGREVFQPIHAVYLSLNAEKNSQSHPRNWVFLGRGSKATLIEHYWGEVFQPYLTNAVTEVHLSKGAVLDHSKIQEESQTAFHIGSLGARQEEGSRLVSRVFAFGARLGRNEVETVLAEKKSVCVLEGLALGNANQHHDNKTFIDHFSPDCRSRELFKMVLDGEANGIFGGRILVRENAQKTDARQTNRNLLLSNDAKVYSKPQLQIYADDVKCSHGSATGQLDEEALFYLRSRGIGLEEARKILVYAFAGEMVEKIPAEYLRTPLRKRVEERLVEK